MSAVLKPKEVNFPSRYSSNQRRSGRPELRTVSASAPATFPLQSLKRPVWLKLLVAGQRISLAAAVLTVLGALFTYGLTVNTNRRLAVATTTLESLQEQQQQLTTANAVFKNHLAQIALTAPEEGALHPREVIFLETIGSAIPAQTSPSAPPQDPPAIDTKDLRFFPKGY